MMILFHAGWAAKSKGLGHETAPAEATDTPANFMNCRRVTAAQVSLLDNGPFRFDMTASIWLGRLAAPI